MRFLFRIIFWLGLVLVLIPRDKTTESVKAPHIGAAEAVQAATAAVSDVSRFCKRQPAACEVGGEAATAIGQRAQQGARRLYRIITDKKAPDHTSSIDAADHADPVNTETSRAPLTEPPTQNGLSQDNLTQDDLALEWRGPDARN